ncbi:MAG: DNA adenine methylase [Candidatus Eremiobacteraeota bacterium]|nr:DNA adenine methylase [Candidatus Eremiobacteraeota bacterium]
MIIPHPIPYQGSKRNIAKHILHFLPKNSGKLIEPFAGSAAISLAAAYYNKANRFALNDINHTLMDLWAEIINQPEDIATKYEVIWKNQKGNERAYYDLIRDKFNDDPTSDRLLYLLARCVKASIRYNSFGKFNQSPDNRRKGTHPDTMRNRIHAASWLLRGKTTVSSKDYREVLKNATPQDLIYMDPPYQGVSINRDPRYIGGVSYEDFVESLNWLNKMKISFMVSYDGRTGKKVHGRLLPEFLGLTRIEIEAGRSTQATLLGSAEDTYESLYLSPALADSISRKSIEAALSRKKEQLDFLAISS